LKTLKYLECQRMDKRFDISIVIPLYNEELIFPELVDRLCNLQKKSNLQFEFVLIDDGSKDKTPLFMRQLSMENDHFHCVFLSKNYGHQEAITAGMKYATGTKAVMLMDGDLQDPPELALNFYDKIQKGYDVVFAVRKKRKEGVIMRFLYWFYYRIQSWFTEVKMPMDSGDFSMMSRQVVDIINGFPEKTRFLRGLRTWVGFNQIEFEYERDSRSAGETKYSFKKLMKLGIDGILSFSDVPLKLITKLGFITIVISLFYISFLIYRKLRWNDIPQGYTTLFIGLSLFSGVQLICLGLIGEYLSRIYKEVKNRPAFIIRNRIVKKNIVHE
ncbi:MAG: glycosyltransferase family 2 protein, partial [Chitinophagaceae bacterium]